MTTVSELLASATRLGDVEARHEAEILLGHALDRSRAWLYAHADFVPEGAAQQRFARLLAARARGEPVAYLIGRRGFWTLDLEVTPDVLIPRAETELLVELALERIPRDVECKVADLGTGSGAIALALASERPRTRVLATDASTAALEVARGNAARLRIHNVEFANGDWCAALGSRHFDVVVSNPPYIADRDAHLGLGDLRFEPSSALASGSDGLDAMRSIVAQARSHLVPGGWLLVEHGHDQGAAVRGLFGLNGYCGIETCRDIELRERVTLAQVEPVANRIGELQD